MNFSRTILTMTVCAACMVSVGPAIATEQDAARCAACHVGDLSLANRSRDELTSVLSAMAAGELSHPTNLTALDEEAIGKLVDALLP